MQHLMERGFSSSFPVLSHPLQSSHNSDPQDSSLQSRARTKKAGVLSDTGFVNR